MTLYFSAVGAASPVAMLPFYGLLPLLTFWPVCKESWRRLDALALHRIRKFRSVFGSITLIAQEELQLRANGTMSIAVILHFHHSLPAGDSDLSVRLSTENANGTRIDRNRRQVTLAGSGTFTGGFLDGETGAVVVMGTLSELP